MEKQITIAVLGSGEMGNTIVQELKSMPEIKRIVCFDPVESQLTKIKANHPQVEITSNLEAIFADEDIKLVFISANNANHVPLAVKALRAGKAVMSEKPSGVDYEQIEELIRVQKETGGFLQVGLECRYSWAYVEAKKAITSGEIGQVKNIHFTYSQPPFHENITLSDGEVVPNWRVKQGTSGNMFLEKLCHYIDLPRWWNEGSKVDKFVVTSAENVIPYYEIEDNVHVSYHFDNGCVSHLYFIATAAPNSGDNIIGKDDLYDQDKQGHKLNFVITGTEGAIEIDVFQREIRFYRHPGKPGQDGEILTRTISWEKDDEGHAEQVWFHNTLEQNRDIVRRVLNGMPPSISIEDAQETMRLCMEFSDATQQHTWEIINR